MGTLPVLEDGELYLSESGAIAEYGELVCLSFARICSGEVKGVKEGCAGGCLGAGVFAP